MGIDVERVAVVTFGLGTALAGAAGVLLAPSLYLYPTVGELLIVKCFVIVVLGGLGSVPGAIAGGILLGSSSRSAPSTSRRRTRTASASSSSWRCCSTGRRGSSGWGSEAVARGRRVLGGAVLPVPLFVTNSFFLHVCILVLMWTVLGAAWNVLGGFAGQVSFGHAALFAVGAYVTIILYLKAGLAPWWGIPIGGLAAALVSLPIGFLCFRLRGPYFSLSTLAVAEIVEARRPQLGVGDGRVRRLPDHHAPAALFFGSPVNWESKAPFYCGGALAIIASRDRLACELAPGRLPRRDPRERGRGRGGRHRHGEDEGGHLRPLGVPRRDGGRVLRVLLPVRRPGRRAGIGLSMEMVFIAVVGGLGTVGGPLIGAVFLTAVARGGPRTVPGGPPDLLRPLHDDRDPVHARGDLGPPREDCRRRRRGG